MRRGSSNLLVIFGLFVLLLAGAGAYLYVFAPGLVPGNTAKALPPTPRPDIEVVEAALDIQPNTLINDTESMLTMGKISGDEFAASPQSYFRSADELRNLKSLGTLRANAPIKRADVGVAGLAMKIPTPQPGKPAIKAFPIQVNALSGVADQIQPGDHVDVMASFNLDVHTIRPSKLEQQESGKQKLEVADEQTNEGTVKVLLQDVQVLDIIKPAPPQATAEGDAQPQPTPQPAQDQQQQQQQQGGQQQQSQTPKNPAASSLQAGNWLLMVGIDSQQAEILRFALDRGIGISTLLRASTDRTTDHTVGATVRILVDNYGMPLPANNPPVQQPSPLQIPNVPTLPEKKVETWAPAGTAEPAK